MVTPFDDRDKHSLSIVMDFERNTLSPTDSWSIEQRFSDAGCGQACENIHTIPTADNLRDAVRFTHRLLLEGLVYPQISNTGHHSWLEVFYAHRYNFRSSFSGSFNMFTGSMVALVTPMQVDGSVDYPALERLVEFHIENQTDAIVSVGTSGESATLTHKENVDVIKQTLVFAAGRVPVIAGTGSNSTAEAIEMTSLAHQAGADAALLVVPYYNKPEQAGLFLHFQAIAKSVAIPQIMYNVPGRTARNMDNDTSVKLAAIGNIVGIKDATADMSAGKDLVERTPDDFCVWSGDDGTTLELIKRGGKGCISVTANAAPLAMHQMCQAALDGDYDRADAINTRLDPLHKNLFIEANPIPVKYAVSRMGLMGPSIRLPLTELAAEHREQVEQAMEYAGITLP